MIIVCYENQSTSQLALRSIILIEYIIGSTHVIDEARMVSLKEVFNLDNSVGVLKDIPCGYCSERKIQNDNWLVKKR